MAMSPQTNTFPATSAPRLPSARLAAEKDEAFQINVSALEKAMPKDLDASEIEVRLGATWIAAALHSAVHA